MSEGYFGKRTKLYIEGLHWGLITSSHILHQHHILDAYGHISVRNPDSSSTFFLSCNIAPALLSKSSDIVEYNIEDAEPVEKAAPEGFAERVIHSEIYKKFPNVNAVVHAHAPEVVPFGVTDVPLRPVMHMAGFLGTEVPVWDVNDASGYLSSSDERRDLLVKTQKTGHHLAAAFRPSTSAGFLTQKLRSALPTQIGGTQTDPSNDPTHPVVLMRGHGFTTCAASLEAAVYQAIYTVEAAKAQTNAILLHDAYHGRAMEGKVDVQGGGKIQNGKVKNEGKDIKYLSGSEVDGTAQFNRDSAMRPWELWCREVEVNPLYRNEVKREDDDT
jgi:ribulose-5-phosphate 4-epimerase/fuculose-1-phosphate aldolase